MMTTYNHAYTFAFSVSGSKHPEGEDVTEEQLFEAIRDRLRETYRAGQLEEAVGAPYDTYKEDE